MKTASLLLGAAPVLMSDHSDIIFCVPLFVELWAQDPAKLEYFKTIDGLVCLVLVAICPCESHGRNLSGMLEHH